MLLTISIITILSSILIIMEIIERIIRSNTEPSNTNVLWDDGENLKIYRNGKWESVSMGGDSLTDIEIDLIWNEVFSGNSYDYASYAFLDEYTNSIGIGDYDE